MKSSDRNLVALRANHEDDVRERSADGLKPQCRYFALCENEATHRRAHPAFPDGVPTCDRCGAKVDALS